MGRISIWLGMVCLTAFLWLLPRAECLAQTETALGSVSGRVTGEDGAPFTKGFVAFFALEEGGNQDVGSTKRSPVMVAFVEEDGRFQTAPFPAGKYSLGAMQRQGWTGGPPRPGETVYSAIDDKGDYLIIEVRPEEMIDVGTVVMRVPKDFPERRNYFTVRGHVLDDKGKPVPDAVVVVKKDIDNPKGLYISQPTAFDGSYELKIPPGKFFLVARKELTKAGRPKPGGYTGTLGQTKPTGIGGRMEEPPAYLLGAAGEIYEDVDITMFQVPIPDVRRKEVEAMVRAKKIDKTSLPEELPLRRERTKGEVQGKYRPVQPEPTQIPSPAR